MWRFRHYAVVARAIGEESIGIQGTPVQVLGKLIAQRQLPKLWEVRSRLVELFDAERGGGRTPELNARAAIDRLRVSAPQPPREALDAVRRLPAAAARALLLTTCSTTWRSQTGSTAWAGCTPWCGRAAS